MSINAAIELQRGLPLSRPGYYLAFDESTGALSVISPHNVVTNPPTVGDATHFGVLGATPVVRQTTYTQTYSTAASVVNPTATADFSGIDNLQAVGTPYAQVADLNTLRADVIALTQVVNKLIDNLQAYGLAG